MPGFRKGGTGHFTAGHGTESHARPQCRGQGLQGRNGLGWRMPGQRGGEGSQQRQLVGLRVQLDSSAVRASRMDVLLLTERSQPHLRRDRAHPRLQLLQDWGQRCPHLHWDSALSPATSAPGLGPATAPPARPRPWQTRRSVVRPAVYRSLRGRSRAKLALAEALARLVRNPRDHASTSGGVVVERGPLRGRSRVREGGPAYARACVRDLHACMRAYAYVRRHVCVRACVRARVRLRCGA